MDQIVAIVLAPIGMFSGKPLAVGIALGILACAVLIWLLIYLLVERKFLGSYRGIARALSSIRQTAGTQEERFAAAMDEFEGTALASSWNQYRSSLEFANGNLFSYTDPAPYLAADRVPGHNYVKWSSTLGGVFLTIGLFFTFVGLSAALLQVGGDGNAPMDTEKLRRAVEGILGVSSVKFITSLAGIGAYIFWSLVARFQADAQDRAVEGLVHEVRQLSSYVAPEMLLQKQLKAIEEQRQQFQTFGNDLAVAIGNQIEMALKARFERLPEAVAEMVGPAVANAFEPVRDDLHRIGDQIKQAGGNIADGAGDVFSKVWQDGIGKHMGLFGTQMEKTIAALESLPEKVKQTETGLGGEIGRVTERLNETAMRLSATFEEGQRSMITTISGFNERIATIPEIVEKASREAAGTVGRSVESSLENLSAITARAGQSSAEQLGAEVAKIATSLAASAESLRAAGDHSAEGLKSARDDLAMGVRDGIKLIADTTQDASAKLSETVAALASVVDGLSSRLDQTTRLLETQQGHLSRAGEIVVGASTSLASAAGNVETATTPLSGAVRTINLALEQVNGASTQVRDATAAGMRMAELLNLSVEKAQSAFSDQATRFSDLHANVNNTMNELVQGVVRLGNQISDCINTYDAEIARSIGSLESAILDVADIVDNRRVGTNAPIKVPPAPSPATQPSPTPGAVPNGNGSTKVFGRPKL
jgi:ABC-type transporter Mla subunit MlaD